MNRICILKATNELIEFQEGNAPLGTLTQNAINAGHQSIDIEESYTNDSIATILLMYESAAKKIIRLKREADASQRKQDIIDNLPDWQTVNTSIDNISDLDGARIFLKKLARVVYWLAKNTSN
jgi:hypothetical protein